MKYLGIDYGAKRVGLAISDDTGSIAFPLEVIATDEALRRVGTLVEERLIGSIVVGDTRSFGGRENLITKEAERFTERLKEDTGIPIVFVQEAGSSIEASRYAPAGEKHDDSAAAIILQRYLDMRTSKID